ncbi:protein yellow-like [Acyrthosiphon pisum]|uniref:Protein yellow n=1 Tax=Acyrthosiphon pisum TaxID=7029 RepID=A0A8R1W0T8_ACYPI|nr:protein yellow-like [Acyrthosiphon pisum]XP_016656931.1 protein yellow-like [Acyrthosiphon pisum]XP_029343768.1 protein yellow-like [Acyrthosiphon pisum]|eukprot:XP_001942648.2 PREDICTED: protein yellow-like [Acyrthosiphon pisum]
MTTTMMPYRCRCGGGLISTLMAAAVLVCGAVAGTMQVEYSWVYVDYTFVSPNHRESAINSGKFIPENCVILDVDIFQDKNIGLNSNSAVIKQRVFVTVPRIKPGNPASIAEVVPGDRPSSVLLAPYPNWKVNTISEGTINCDNTIVSVFRTKIDYLGRFWVVDVGTLDQFDMAARSVCPPKLLIFDLKNGDRVIKKYKFPSSQVKDVSLFTNIEVDIRDSKACNTFAYITDTDAYKLVVYDFKNDESWVIDQAYFYPFPNKAHFKIKGVDLDFMDGILGLALGPIIQNDRKLYFHAFASIRESWVNTNTLQNKSMFQNGLIDGSGRFFLSSEVRETQSSVEVMTDNGVLIYASMDNSLGCWNTQDPFTTKYIHTIYKSDEDFQFPSGMKIVGDKVWAVSSQLQNQFTTMVTDSNSVKYRVLVGQVDELIKSTGCNKRLASNIQNLDPSKDRLVFSSK